MSIRDFFGRDKRGRWTKGFCPNPNGRPRKKPPISDADVGYFKQTAVEATINGEKRLLSRHELLLHSAYDQAIKGKSVSLARKLLDRFEDVDLMMAQARDVFQQDAEAFLKKCDETGEFDHTQANKLLALSEALNYGHKRKPPRLPRSTTPATWRNEPKPQSLLDLEKEEAAAFLDEARKRARRGGLPFSPEDEDDDNDNDDGSSKA